MVAERNDRPAWWWLLVLMYEGDTVVLSLVDPELGIGFFHMKQANIYLCISISLPECFHEFSPPSVDMMHAVCLCAHQ